jgi:hypothetical protein
MDDHTTPTSPTIRMVTGCDDEFYCLELAEETDVSYKSTPWPDFTVIAELADTHELAQ